MLRREFRRANRTTVVLLLLCSFAHGVSAEGENQPSSGEASLPGKWGMEGRITYGFLIAHRVALMPLQQQHLYSAEASFFKTTSGEHEWETGFLYPEKGIHVAWIQPGSPEKLGNAFAVYPYLDFPLYEKTDQRFWLRYGMGLGYIQHVFDPVTNYTNSAIGSHLNGVIHIGLSFRKNVDAHTVFSIGAGMTHFSNGSFRMPNLGINLPAATVGINRYFGSCDKKISGPENDTVRSGSLAVFAAGGLKEIYPALGPRYHTVTISSTYFFPSSHKSDLGLGLDLFYDNSLSVKNGRETGDYSKSADYRPGIYGAYQLRIASLGLLFNMGFYPYTAYKNDGFFYHRIGLRYYFKNLFLCINLKTHYARADFIEWGLGWNFNRKRTNP